MDISRFVFFLSVIAMACEAQPEGPPERRSPHDRYVVIPAVPDAPHDVKPPAHVARAHAMLEPGGWQLRETVPYPRAGHSAVLDTKRDRMVVFGGGANDTWVLPLSGHDANVWQPLTIHGKHPPAHSYEYTSTLDASDSAVYDPIGDRMLVCLNLSLLTGASSRTEVWELAFAHGPVWRRLAVLPPPDGAELKSARVVYDSNARRLLLLGGDGTSGLWSLTLDDAPTFTRIADAPPIQYPFYSMNTTLLFDAKRNRVVLFSEWQIDPRVHALSLDDLRWQVIDDAVGSMNASTSRGLMAAFDAKHDRMVLVGGYSLDGTVTYSFEDAKWTAARATAPASSWVSASVVVDEARDRLILFGGQVLDRERVTTNATWALSLRTLTWSALNDLADHNDLGDGNRAYVYDPARDAVVAFGGCPGPVTLSYQFGAHQAGSSLAPWSRLSHAGDTPCVEFTSAVYDPQGEAIVTFGGYHTDESRELSRFASRDDAVWEVIDAGTSPLARAEHTSVYDSQNKRMIVFAGKHDISYPPTRSLGDVWSLSLDGAPRWSELEASGDAPGEGVALAAYDPDGKRMLVHMHGDDFALSLDGAPKWTKLVTAGHGPSPDARGSAVFDPDGHRMIAVELAEQGVRVFALPVQEPLTWHEYCPDTLTPGVWPDDGTTAVLVPDGLFVELAGAAYRFDLSTPYCE